MVFTYMGTKKPIAPHVAEIVCSAKQGPFLDLFSGVSSVGVAVAPTRQVWCNDVQRFAATFAGAIFTSKSAPNVDAQLLSKILDRVQLNKARLMPLIGEWIVEECDVFTAGKIRRIQDLCARQIISARSRKALRIRKARNQARTEMPYCLFSFSYIGGYVGAKQALDIDCLSYSFDKLKDEHIIDDDQHRWFFLALCRALFSIAFTTGHFAQYLDVKTSTRARFLAKRRRDVLTEWVDALKDLAPIGSSSWREKNQVFNQDSVDLVRALKGYDNQPSVVYADPPYTKDQYSRYYHLLETLLAYDYPSLVGKGQYRPDRFVSRFSLRSKVASELDHLVRATAALGADFVLNYPQKGLLEDAEVSILTILRKHFRRAEVAASIPHHHSTLGAANGVESAPVTELIFYAS